jgi:transposase
MAERSGASAAFGAQLLELQQQLFEQWHRYKVGTIDWLALQQECRSIRLACEATLQQVVELGVQRGERTPWANTVRTCQKLLKVVDALWTFLETEGIEPTNNAAGRALRPSVIQRKVSHGVQSSRPRASSAGHACSPSPPPSGNRVEMSDSSWNKPGLPITVAM